MRWADSIFARTTPRRPRLTVHPLEDRAVPHGHMAEVPGIDDPSGSDVEIVEVIDLPSDPISENGPTGGVVEPGGTAPDGGVEPGDPKPDPVEGPEVVVPDEPGVDPVSSVPPGDEVIYYTMGPAAPTGEAAAAVAVSSLWLGDRVWRDSDGDGHQDGNEAGIAGIAVRLYRGDVLVGSTVTSATGGYLFTPSNVHNGTPADPTDDGLHARTAYQVRIALDQPGLAGLRPTRTDVGDDSDDSDATSATGAAVVALTTGDAWSVMQHDVGFAPAAGIGNQVWNDANNNGKRDTGEAGLGGVAVRLLDATGTTEVAATTTAADGTYHFGDLLPGSYIVEVATGNFTGSGALTGYMSSTGKPGSATGPYEGPATTPKDGFDSGLTANGVVRSAAVAAGEKGEDAVDFGFVQTGGGITGKVFRDRNGDGQIDLLNAEERTGLDKVRVRASGPGGTFFATTDEDGAYAFPNLPAGSYAVTQVGQPKGFASTTPDTVLVQVGSGPVTVNFGEQARADLQVTQTVSRTRAGIGDEVVITFKVKNRGAADATDVKVRTQGGVGLKLVPTAKATSATGTFDNPTGLWTVGTVPAGEEATYTIKMRVKAKKNLGMTAWAGTGSKEDAVGDNKSFVRVKAQVPLALRALWLTNPWR